MSDFKPFILPEEPVPSFATACQLCELSKQRKRVIWGEGNPNAPIFIILDNPGSRENREGEPFLCGTRETLQQGMNEAGLGIDLVYVSYLVKCRPIRAYNKALARETCSSHLKFQLANKRPCIIFGLGNIVVQSLFPEQEAEVKNYRGRWHVFDETPIAFSYHPLAVRRRPNLMKYFIDDINLVVEKMKEIR